MLQNKKNLASRLQIPNISNSFVRFQIFARRGFLFFFLWTNTFLKATLASLFFENAKSCLGDCLGEENDILLHLHSDSEGALLIWNSD